MSRTPYSRTPGPLANPTRTGTGRPSRLVPVWNVTRLGDCRHQEDEWTVCNGYCCTGCPRCGGRDRTVKLHDHCNRCGALRCCTYWWRHRTPWIGNSAGYPTAPHGTYRYVREYL